MKYNKYNKTSMYGKNPFNDIPFVCSALIEGYATTGKSCNHQGNSIKQCDKFDVQLLYY